MSTEETVIRLFVVNDRPFAIWGYSDDENKRFLQSFEPHYFSTNANMLATQIKSDGVDADEKHLFATQLRTLYAHALETFVALMFARLQAPDCVQAWLIKYGNSDLYALADCVLEGKEFLSRSKPASYNLQNVVQVIYNNEEREDIDRITQWYGYLLKEFASKERQAEYNSVKHGFRGTSSPFSMSIQPTGTAGLSLKSDFGIGFGEIDLVEPVKRENKINIVLNHRRLNWSPEAIAESINIITALMYNTVAYLKAFFDIEDIKTYQIPADSSLSAFLTRSGASWPTSFTSSRKIAVDSDDLVTAEMVLKSYE